MKFNLNINGIVHKVEALKDTPLLWVLRDILGLKGTKYGCGAGLCGACTVHIDGQASRACQILAVDVQTAQITTIEGVSATAEGRKLQEAWLALDVAQCGYCQPGQIMSACALLRQEPRPSQQAIHAAMAGNICRCATYLRIQQAIQHASDSLSHDA